MEGDVAAGASSASSSSPSSRVSSSPPPLSLPEKRLTPLATAETTPWPPPSLPPALSMTEDSCYTLPPPLTTTTTQTTTMLGGGGGDATRPPSISSKDSRMDRMMKRMGRRGNAVAPAGTDVSDGLGLNETRDEANGTGRVRLDTAKALSLGEQYRNYVRQSFIEITRNKCQFCLGCGSICLVVFVVAVSLTTLSFAPILLLGLAEASSGEIDMIVVPGGGAALAGINYTYMNEILAINGSSNMLLNAPRYISSEFAYNPNQCTGYMGNPTDSSWAYANNPVPNPDSSNTTCNKDPSNCVNKQCSGGVSVNVAVIDTNQEAQIGIGRTWDYPPIPEMSCYIYQSAARRLRVNKGDTILLALDFLGNYLWYAEAAGYNSTTNITTVSGQGIVYLMLEVSETLPSGMGKFSSSTDFVVMLEMNTFMGAVSYFANQSWVEGYRDAIAVIDMRNYVNNVAFNLPAPRYNYYGSSDFPTVARGVITWASSIVYLLGINEVGQTLPVLGQLYTTRNASSFLNLVLNLIIILLAGISILLIYSLLLISVESRTFELGIFRMIGLNRIGLIQMLLVHAMMFAIPAWAISLLLSQFAFVGLAVELEALTMFPINSNLTAEAILVATFLGIIIPILAAILPIRAALTKNLHDALDTVRPKVKAVEITVERSSKDQYAGAALSVGVLTTIVGFLIYYLLPSALLYSNATLLFNIFLLIIVGMMFGLVLLALNIQPLLERFLIWLVFTFVLFFENAAMAITVSKNMQSHRRRNRKTSITYATAMGFLIFLAVAVDLEINSIFYDTNQTYGAIVSIEANMATNGKAIGISPRKGLEEWALNNTDIVDFGWISYNLQTCWNYRVLMQVTNLGQYVFFGTGIYGVSPNLWSAFLPGYTSVSSQIPDTPYSLGELLYSQYGDNAIITASYFGSQFGIDDPNKEILVRVTTNDVPIQNVTSFPVHAVALLDQTPRFSMSSFPNANEDMTVSFPYFVTMSAGQYQSVEDIPMAVFIIQLRPDMTNSEIDAFIASVEPLNIGYVDDVRGQYGMLVNQQDTIQWIFQVVTVFTLIIAFFSLSTSMFTNIIEQTKEVGILRAVGLSRFPVFRIYMYEAFFLVISSAILGGLIGLAVGWTLSKQRGLLTETPIPFIFPWQLSITVLLVAIGSAIFSTVLPVGRLMAMQVVGIFRLK